MNSLFKNHNAFLYITEGCELLRNDVSRLTKYLKLNGLQITTTLEDADLIIISGCGYNPEREEIFFKKYSKIKKLFSNKQKVISFGCITKIAKEKVLEEFNGLIFGPREYSKLDKFIGAKFPYSQAWSSEIFDDPTDVYQLSVGIGCMGNCSFCAIRFAKGRIRSVPLNLIIERFKKGLLLDYKKFSLIGDDVACYGVDIDLNLNDLLKAIFSIKDFFLLNINYLDPEYFVLYYEEIKKYFSDERFVTVCIPIQSSNPRVLKLMNRNYKTESVLKIVDEIKKRNRFIEIRTHIMCGFPSETDDEWEETVKVAKHFDVVMAGQYWDRPNTLASKLKNKISRKLISKRFDYLHREMSNYKILEATSKDKQPDDVIIFGRNSRAL